MGARALGVIHSTAQVDPTAIIGAGTVVWQFACIGAGAVLGEDCKIGQAVYVDRNVRIGNRAWIQNKASIYRPVTLGDDVFVGPHVVFVNDPDPTPWTTRDLTGRTWRVEDGVTIGANATILSDINLGHHCFIGAGAVVTRPTDAYGVYAGVPARLIGFRCVCRQRFSAEEQLPKECPQCGRRL